MCRTTRCCTHRPTRRLTSARSDRRAPLLRAPRAIIGEEALIANGTTVLDGAKVGARSLVAAHSLVAAGADIPPGVSAVAGSRERGDRRHAGGVLGKDEPDRLCRPRGATPQRHPARRLAAGHSDAVALACEKGRGRRSCSGRRSWGSGGGPGPHSTTGCADLMYSLNDGCPPEDFTAAIEEVRVSTRCSRRSRLRARPAEPPASRPHRAGLSLRGAGRLRHLLLDDGPRDRSD